MVFYSVKVKFYLLYPSFSLFWTSFPQIASDLERDHFKNVCSNFVPLEYIRIDNKVVILLERLFFLNRILWVQVVIWLSTWHSYIIGIDEYPTSLVEVFSWKLIILIRHQVGRYIIRMCDWLFISLLDVCWFFYNSLLERIYIFLRMIWSRFQIILSALKPSITVTLRLHYLHFHVSDFCFLEPSRKKPNVRYIFLPSFSKLAFFSSILPTSISYHSVIIDPDSNFFMKDDYDCIYRMVAVIFLFTKRK